MKQILSLFIALSATCGCASLHSVSPLAPLEKSVIYQPAKYPVGDWQSEQILRENAWFTAADGTKLHGWFLPHKKPRAVVLFMHGNAGNVTHRADTLRILNERHSLAVMTFDYRGYGLSEGDPNELGILQDARAARAWLAERTDVEESDIVLMGRSLGGGVAVDLASKDGARGLVLASTFTSLPDVGGQLLPLVPTGLLMTQRLHSLSKIGDYQGPLLQTHGTADRVIPFEMGQRLFEAAPGPKRFIAIEGGDHNCRQPEEYRIALDEFLSSLPAARSLSDSPIPVNGSPVPPR